jgi:hypothetical protein
VVWEGRRREAPPYPDQPSVIARVAITSGVSGCHRPKSGRIGNVMTESPPDSPQGSTSLRHGEILAHARETAVVPPPDARALSPEGAAALDAAQALARHATAPATLRAYKADWTHSCGTPGAWREQWQPRAGATGAVTERRRVVKR